MKKTTIILLLLFLPLSLFAGWDIVTNMPNPRHGLSAVELDGKIYVIGGQERHHGGGLPSVDIVTAYDPVSNEWDEEIAPLNHARRYAFAAAHNGYIYVAGGRDGVTPVPQVERYDPATNEWRDITELPYPRIGLGGAILGDSLFVIGGDLPDSESGEKLSRVDIYRFSDSTWTEGPPLHQARTLGLTVQIQNHLVVLGGLQLSPLTSTEIYENGSWSTGPDLPHITANFGGVTLGDSIVIAGGAVQDGNTRECYILDGDTWSEASELNHPREGLSMATSGDKVYAFGGRHRNVLVSQVEMLTLEPVATAEEPGSIPETFALGNYPNPFNPETTIRAVVPDLPSASHVALQVYNALGQKIYTSEKTYTGAGDYTWRFDVTGLREQPAGGVYFYSVMAGHLRQTEKMIYLP